MSIICPFHQELICTHMRAYTVFSSENTDYVHNAL